MAELIMTNRGEAALNFLSLWERPGEGQRCAITKPSIATRQPGDFKFRRQVPVGSFIADFPCEETKLIIEVDGGQHDTLQAKDNKRMALLQAQGYHVIRFWNNEVLEQPQAVLGEVSRALETLAPLAASEQKEGIG